MESKDSQSRKGGAHGLFTETPPGTYPQVSFPDHRTSITLLNTRPSAPLYAQMLQETILEETGLR